MTEHEIKRLKALIINTADYYSKQIKPTTVSMMAQDLADLSFAEVEKAYEKIRLDPNQKFFPLPAVVREFVDGYPSAEEAFGLLPKNEEESYVTCNEIAIAFDRSRSFLLAGDMHGFRIVFMETYRNQIAESRLAKLKPKWWASLGRDVEKRDDCLKKAVEQNRLTPQGALSYNPMLELPPPTRTQLALNTPSRVLIGKAQEEFPGPDEMTRQQRAKEIREMVEAISKKSEIPTEEKQ